MATADFWQRVTENITSPQQLAERPAAGSSRSSRGMTALWMVMDGVTILASTLLVTFYEKHTGPVAGAMRLWRNTFNQSHSMMLLLAVLCGFTVRAHHYQPAVAFVYAVAPDQLSA